MHSQIERNKLSRERQLREQAEKEKEELQQQLRHFQEESRLAHEALVRFVCGHRSRKIAGFK